MKIKLFFSALLLLFLALMPIILGDGAALTVASQTGVWILFALAYSICLSQTGLLSFCHALFFGIGAFGASHAVNAVVAGHLPFIPVWLMPLVGFLAGGALGIVLAGFLCYRVGAAFAMITLGLSQLCIYWAVNLRSIFGGEGGISIDRAYGGSFGPQDETYWLILAWVLVGGGIIWLLGQTSFGKLASAVRENAERVRFVGQNVTLIRFAAITLSAAFAGMAGGLHAINIEQVSTDLMGLRSSAFVLFMCVIGGTRHFAGPIIGAIILVLLDKVLPNYTGNWLLYLGLIFSMVILRGPGGIMGLFTLRFQQLPIWRQLIVPDALRAAGVVLMAASVVLVLEMARSLGAGASYFAGNEMSLFGMPLNPRSIPPWIAALSLLLAGRTLLKRLVSSAKN